MNDLGKTKKLCANGHLMDPAWEVCPYCPAPSNAPRPELAATVRVEDMPAAAPAADQGARKTELMQRPLSIQGLGWLVGTHMANKGQTHRIDGERVTLGADANCDIVLSSEHISERHASVRFQDASFVLTDLDSSNGTFVNGDEVQQESLKDGDRVRFGPEEFVFKCVVFDEA